MRSLYLAVHLFQKHAFKAQGCHQQLAGVVCQALYGKVVEHCGKLGADFLICCDEREIRILLRSFLVIVARTDLGNILNLPIPLAGDKRKLGVHLIIFKPVNDGAARLFQAFGIIDVALLVKAGAQFHNGNHFFAVFGGADKRLDNLGLMRHPV